MVVIARSGVCDVAISEIAAQKTFAMTNWRGLKVYVNVNSNFKLHLIMLTEQQKQKIIGIARETLDCYLSGKDLPPFAADDPVLQEKRGVFVTLKKGGELRGCIGYIQPVKPLAEAVREVAVQSATSDPRFPSVRHKELKEISIEISVLTVPEKVTADEVILGRDGVIVKKGCRQGVFLPQVAGETGWSKEEFLGNLCLHKAGLPSDSWKKPDTEIYTFQAEVFSGD
jgi:AmmeMemoRadiSam system protein A